MSKYAARTEVSASKSETEIKATLRRYGATAIATAESDTQAQIMFEMRDRRIVMRMRLPDKNNAQFTHVKRGNSRSYTPRQPSVALGMWEQACRQQWRALALCIKAKLEAVESGIETFDDAFLAHVMLPTGETFGDWAKHPENLPAALSGAKLPPLLPGSKQ